MTVIDHAPETDLPLFDLIPDLLPEQDWREDCAVDENSAPGMPREVVDRSLEVDSAWGDDPSVPLYDVTHFVCGHTIARLA